MRICPNKKFELLSPLTKENVIEKLSQNIDYLDSFGVLGIRRNSFRNYEGNINRNEIKFRRILKSGANSFIPQIKAQISEVDNKTCIRLDARLHKVIEGFMIGFNCFLFLLSVTELFNIDNTSSLGLYSAFLNIPIFMIVLSNAIPRLIFNFELYRLEKDFRKILKCIDPRPSNDNGINRILEKLIMIF